MIDKQQGAIPDMAVQRVQAVVPFVLPQVLFQGGRTQQKMGQGMLAQVVFASASTDVTIAHNLGHPINCVWVVSCPAGTFFPQIRISSSGSSNTTKQTILQASAPASCTVALF